MNTYVSHVTHTLHKKQHGGRQVKYYYDKPLHLNISHLYLAWQKSILRLRMNVSFHVIYLISIFKWIIICPTKMRQCYYVKECLCKCELTKYNLQSFIKTMININDAAGTKRNNCIIQSNQVVLCWCCKVTMLVNERLLSYLNGKESSLNSGTMIFQVQNLRCMIKINIMSFFHGCVWKNETVLR